MDETQEQFWVQGNRAANVSMLHHCLRELGYATSEASESKWIAEREAVVSALRSLCEEFGDNEWDEQLHLADVIEKHLARHLLAPDAEPFDPRPVWKVGDPQVNTSPVRVDGYTHHSETVTRDGEDYLLEWDEKREDG